MLLSTLTGDRLPVVTRRFMPLLVLLMSSWLLNFAQAQSFTSAQVETGANCNWPYSSVATNPVDGKIYAFWRKGSGATVTYKLIRFDGSSWAAVGSFGAANVATNFSAADDVGLAIDATGKFHVVFRGEIGGGVCCNSTRGVWYGSSTNGTSWTFTAVETYSDPSGWKNTDDPVLELDATNKPHIVFLFSDANNPRTYTLRYLQFNGSSWTGQNAFSQPGGPTLSNEITNFDFALDGSGKAHIAFQRETDGSGLDGGLWYVTNASGAWASPVVLAAGAMNQQQGQSIGIDIDATNKVNIVHGDYLGKLHFATNASGAFTSTQINGNLTGSFHPRNFSINSNGDRFLVHSGNKYAYLLEGTSGNWTTGTAYTPPADAQSGTFYSGLLAPNGRIMVLYDNLPGGDCSAENPRSLWYATATVTIHPDYQPLVDLYNSTNGPNWNNNTGWLNGYDPCSGGWRGVTCSGGRVTKINLPYNALTGTLPGSLSGLTNLQELDLFNNQLSGSLPESWSGLTNLQYLYLHDNQLSGSLPGSWSALTNLQDLDLFNNQLSGSLPESWSGLTNLQYLYLHDNQLSGCIPASYSVFCGKVIYFSANAGLPGGGDFDAFCSNGTGKCIPLAVTLSASQSAVCTGGEVTVSASVEGAVTPTYQWYKGAAALTGNPSATTASLKLSNVQAADAASYSVVVTEGVNSITSSAFTLSVNNPPTASITASSTTLTCATPSATLTASGGSSYLWEDNSTSAMRSVSSAGTYSVTVTGANGCQATSSVTLSEDKTPPTASISASATTIHLGQSVTLTASGGTQYAWSTGATTAAITVQPSQSTLYSVTVTAANGCSTAKSVSITVIVPIGLTAPAKVCVKAAPPLKTVVTLPIIMQLSGGSAPYTYSWSYKAPSSTVYKAIPSGGTSIGKVSFVPVAGKATLNLIGTKGNLNGLQGYIVRLTVKDQTYTASAQTLLDGSCTLGSSPARQGVFEAEQVQVRVYPNPVAEELQVEIQGLGQPAKVSLYDLQGRQRGYWSVEVMEGRGQVKAKVAELAQGLYILQVETTEGVLHRQRVLKLQ